MFRSGASDEFIETEMELSRVWIRAKHLVTDRRAVPERGNPSRYAVRFREDSQLTSCLTCFVSR